MKPFLLGVFGALLVLVLAVILLPLYSDYSDRVMTERMLITLGPLKESIENQLKNKQKIILNPKNYNLSPHISFIEISEMGVITVRGDGSGQVFILTPSSNGIKWRCLGGPYKAMPSACR